jgi:hypothetical protein
MATYSGAYAANAGFNQSGGGYYIILSTVTNQLNTYTAPTGSGGAATAGTFAINPDASGGYLSTLLQTNKVLRDMGKTVVSSGRVFRKFQAVAPRTLLTNGVAGPNSASASAYFTGYLEVSRDGESENAARIARYA